ncbi:hypothetical protein P691DRAFT_770837 [Macrolepiota fuliginosa MF-IS2]|uniref:N-acetyltransferase domain-containing protein n=1 Tax=Macrolepiota fuliginosa MF-IS2 TaxID=1400762 RepID=A0A9P5XP31_9AGAR|nr:hypothetical protein P691DRAFT_770837 [Macrolepiota fuliginosa MF-IS2]
MPIATTQIETRVFRSAVPLLNACQPLFKGSPEQYNIIYPQTAQAVRQEIDGTLGDDNLWITCSSGAQVSAPDLVLSCNEDSHGNKLPIFIASSLPMATLSNTDFLMPRLQRLVATLYDEISRTRVFSVFAVAPITIAFSQLWTEKTGIPRELQPYYSATYARCTKQSFRNKQFTILGDTSYDLRLAERNDVDAVSDLCHGFALTSPPFILTPQKACEEAEFLINHKQVWVHTINRPGAKEEIASIVAVTRESASVSAITKVFTNPRWRGKRCAERLVRYVTKILLYKHNKEAVVLYVGRENAARKVYQRVGFTAPSGQALCDDQGSNEGHWLELGFDREQVVLGHW